MWDKNISDIEFDPSVLKAALDAAQIKQNKFNEMLGYKQPNIINKIIKRKRAATASDLLKMSAALNKSPSEFCKT